VPEADGVCPSIFISRYLIAALIKHKDRFHREGAKTRKKQKTVFGFKHRNEFKLRVFAPSR
jgi:hypothetical protein